MLRIRTAIPALLVALTATAVTFPAVADAASGSDLSPAIIAPTSTRVGDAATYRIRVNNTGNATSGAVSIVVQLPTTSTSPNVHISGVLSNVDTNCTVSGTTLRCALPGIKRGKSASVYFGLALPYRTTPMVVTATVGTNNDINSFNDTANRTAAQNYYTVPSPADGATVQNSHCTGTALTSYYDCIVTPTSTSSHLARFTRTSANAGTIDFSVQGPDLADFGGTWSRNGAQLVFEYTELGIPVANFVGVGSSTNCWDGIVTFPTPGYVSAYRVCL